MKLTHTLLASAALLSGLSTAQAQDEEDSAHFLGGTFSANVSITTDYTFRGISQSSTDAAVQGGIDWASDLFYVGTWASTVDFNDDRVDPFTGEVLSDGAQIELDLYGGITPTFGDVSFDFGVIYYLYPGAPNGADDFFVPSVITPEVQDTLDFLGIEAGPGALIDNFRDQNYLELKAAASYSLGIIDTGVTVIYSPDYYFDAGDLILTDVSASFPLGGAVPLAGDELSFSVSGNIGYLEFLDEERAAETGFFEDYWDFGIGVTATWWGIDFDARYIDTFGLAGNGSTGVFTVSKSF